METQKDLQHREGEESTAVWAGGKTYREGEVSIYLVGINSRLRTPLSWVYVSLCHFTYET